MSDSPNRFKGRQVQAQLQNAITPERTEGRNIRLFTLTGHKSTATQSGMYGRGRNPSAVFQRSTREHQCQPRRAAR